MTSHLLISVLAAPTKLVKKGKPPNAGIYGVRCCSHPTTIRPRLERPPGHLLPAAATLQSLNTDAYCSRAVSSLGTGGWDDPEYKILGTIENWEEFIVLNFPFNTLYRATIRG